MENPYFRVPDMDCWPCSSVYSIPDLTGRSLTQSMSVGAPYTMEDNNNIVGIKDLAELYETKQSVFDIDAKRISSNNPLYRYTNIPVHLNVVNFLLRILHSI